MNNEIQLHISLNNLTSFVVQFFKNKMYTAYLMNMFYVNKIFNDLMIFIIEPNHNLRSHHYVIIIHNCYYNN